jgi:hypothetical protein
MITGLARNLRSLSIADNVCKPLKRGMLRASGTKVRAWRIYVGSAAVEKVAVFHAVFRKVYFVPTLQILLQFLQ